MIKCDVIKYDITFTLWLSVVVEEVFYSLLGSYFTDISHVDILLVIVQSVKVNKINFFMTIKKYALEITFHFKPYYTEWPTKSIWSIDEQMASMQFRLLSDRT